MVDFRILSLGDAALTIEFGQEIDPAVNTRVIAFAERLQMSLCVIQNWVICA